MNTTEDRVTYKSTTTVTGGSLLDLQPEQRANALRGAQILAKALKAEGVDVLFGYPGGANLEIFDALPGFGIRCVRTEHEQGAVHAAQGFARATGKVGVCLATSGPGATNLVTGIADANSDSTPIVCITGNVPSHLLGKNAFQEVDIVAITQPITKRSYLIKRVTEIPEVVREGFALAGGNRPGPVLIDIPKDIQQHYPKDAGGNYIPPQIPAVVECPEPGIGGLTSLQLSEACRLLGQAERPVIYAGGGIVSADCAKQLLTLAEKLDCPVTTTVMGHGAFPPDHSLALHCLSMHGSKYANVAINEADVVLAIGVRFDDRVTGKPETFIEHGQIIHIDIDRNELNKNKPVTLAACADLAIALSQLTDCIETSDHMPWVSYLNTLKAEYPFEVPETAAISPQFAISLLSDVTNGDAIISLGVGQHQMWAMQHYRSRRSHSFLSSSGFGTMGYGLPAAIGAKVAEPERQVIDVDGDGSLNMTIQELATCGRYGIGVKIVVINNQWLGMVRQWQDMIYDGHRAGSGMADPMAVKSADELDIYPDFPTIAAGYRVKAERVTDPQELPAAYERMLADPSEPYLLDVIVEAEENVYPMIPAGGSYKDIIMDSEGMESVLKGTQGANV
ncbi:biosynthetic-type acetolactate synthase large subunit [Pseudohaliea sp.]|uniref:biosynthetic-type acetolactate synthase large subunit n=1 Tax=Pseudohaliea sp. TaxID=2740289 RepID=UPI0032ECD1B1